MGWQIKFLLRFFGAHTIFDTEHQLLSNGRECAGGGKGPSLTDLTRVNLTNLGREMYPALHVTKQEVITYYIRMAPRILPFVQ